MYVIHIIKLDRLVLSSYGTINKPPCPKVVRTEQKPQLGSPSTAMSGDVHVSLGEIFLNGKIKHELFLLGKSWKRYETKCYNVNYTDGNFCN